MAQRVAFLVGNQTFRNDSGLLPLRGPLNDVAALSNLLRNPERGGFEVHEFLDKPHHEILPEIEQALGGAAQDDLVLVYYSGHGKLDRNGHLCLATADTREGRLLATSIPARRLREFVDQSDCQQVVLLLDCCYSGAVEDGLRGDVGSELRVVEDARGFYILTASTDRQTARETEPAPGGDVMGRSTAALVEGIESGAADRERKGRVLLSDLHRHLGRAITGQTPQFFARKASGDPLISRSPAAASSTLDPNAVADLQAENWHRRLGAVSYLSSIVKNGPLLAQQAASTLLKQQLLIERDVEVRRHIEQAIASLTYGNLKWYQLLSSLSIHHTLYPIVGCMLVVVLIALGSRAAWRELPVPPATLSLLQPATPAIPILPPVQPHSESPISPISNSPLRNFVGQWSFAGVRGCNVRFGTITVATGFIRFEWRLANGGTNRAIEKIDRIDGNDVYTTVVSDEDTNNSELGQNIRYTVLKDEWTSENLFSHQRARHVKC